MNIFMRAAKKKLRFDVGLGMIQVEDLWDLSLMDLNEAAKAVSRQVKDQGEEGFIPGETAVDPDLKLSLDILKAVIEDKIAAAETAQKRKASIERKQRIMALMADKQDEALKANSLEELEAMLAEME